MAEERELHGLAKLIEDKFEVARRAKLRIEEKMLKHLYAFTKKYTPEKLRQIRELGGSEIYIPLTNIKIRALKAWLTDIFFGSDDVPFDLQPTPVPELLSDVRKQMEDEVRRQVSEVLVNIMRLEAISGGSFNSQMALDTLRDVIENTKKRIDEQVYEYSEKLAEREKKRIDDQFTEGGFYEALDSALLDLGIFPAAILKACVPSKVKRFDKNRAVVEEIIPTYVRVSPFDLFPSPYVPDFSDFVIEILHFLPKDLDSVRDLEGYVPENIELILSLYGDTGYTISTNYRTERLELEGKDVASVGSLIDVREFWGTVKGELISDYVDIEDKDNWYDVVVWECDGYILRCILNPNPLGDKPYAKASFITIPNSFWGMSLAEVLEDLQDGVNALSRAIINNSVLSSGPMVERNIDRIPAFEEKTIIPWKIFDSTGLGYDNSPAYRFYQPNLTAGALIQVMMYFMKMADELSGVPSYAHGDITGGSVGARTASGLTMLMTNANRGIKEVVKNVDRGIIEPVVRMQYYLNVIDFYGTGDEVPDLNIKAKGSSFLAERLAQTQKLLELLSLTSNPIDLQLVGIEGRKYLLDKVFRNFGIDIPEQKDLEELVNSLRMQLQQMAMSGQGLPLPNQIPKPKEELPPVTQESQNLRRESLGGVV